MGFGQRCWLEQAKGQRATHQERISKGHLRAFHRNSPGLPALSVDSRVALRTPKGPLKAKPQVDFGNLPMQAAWTAAKG